MQHSLVAKVLYASVGPPHDGEKNDPVGVWEGWEADGEVSLLSLLAVLALGPVLVPV